MGLGCGIVVNAIVAKVPIEAEIAQLSIVQPIGLDLSIFSPH
jgi:hypothetical protein